MIDRPRILFVTWSAPLPLRNGGSQRTYCMLRSLQKIGDVTLVLYFPNIPPTAALKIELARTICPDTHLMAPTNLHDSPPPASRWQRLIAMLRFAAGGWKDPFRLDRPVQEAIRRLGHFDLAVSRYLNTAMRVDLPSLAPAIVDVDDAPYELYEIKARRPNVGKVKRWLARRQLSLLPKILVPTLRRCGATWITKTYDRQWPGLSDAIILPNIPAVLLRDQPPVLPNTAEAGPVALFIGSFAWPPNEQGMIWFVEKAWPLVRQRIPSATLLLAGGGLAETLRAQWAATAGVEVLGEVPDVDTVYARAALTICPMFSGGGTNIKVLESLALGRPCVLTSHGLRGHEHVLKPGDTVEVGDDPSAMADAVVALLNDPARRSAMGQRGREIVANHFSFEAFAGIVASTVTSVLSRSDKAKGVS